MKFTRLLTAVSVAASLGLTAQAALLSTAFTYHGRLNDGTNPATGSYDLRFAVQDAASGGIIVGKAVTNSAVGVTNGLFNAVLDFGPGVFEGSARWLEVAVRTNGTGAFTALAPLQLITAMPYALYAPMSGIAASASSVAATNILGTVPLVALPGAVVTNHQSGVTLAGVFGGNGAGLTNIVPGITGVTNPMTDPSKLKLIAVGDSLTAGTGWFSYLTTQFPPWKSASLAKNLAVAGINLNAISTNLASGLATIPLGAGSNGIVFFWGGAHDVWDTYPSPMAGKVPQFVGTLSNCMEQIHAAGYKSALFTVMGLTNALSNSSNEVERTAFNNGLSRLPNVDYFIDVAQLFPNPLDPNLFLDGVHLTTNGYWLLAKAVDHVLSSGPGNVSSRNQTLTTLVEDTSVRTADGRELARFQANGVTLVGKLLASNGFSGDGSGLTNLPYTLNGTNLVNGVMVAAGTNIIAVTNGAIVTISAPAAASATGQPASANLTNWSSVPTNVLGTLTGAATGVVPPYDANTLFYLAGLNVLDTTRRYSTDGLPGPGTTANPWTPVEGVFGAGYQLTESNRWTWTSTNAGTMTNYAVSLWLRNPVCSYNAVGSNLPSASIFVEPFLFELEGTDAAYPHWFLYWNGSAVALGLSTMVLDAGGTNIHNFGQVSPATWADGGWHQLGFSQTESVTLGANNTITTLQTFAFYVDGVAVSTLPLTVAGNSAWQHMTKASSVWIGTNAIGVWALGSTFRYDLDELKIEGDLPAGQTPASWMTAQYQNPRGVAQVAVLSADQTFTGANTLIGVVAANHPANTFGGSFSGNGAGLTNLHLDLASSNQLTGVTVAAGTNIVAVTNGNIVTLSSTSSATGSSGGGQPASANLTNWSGISTNILGTLSGTATAGGPLYDVNTQFYLDGSNVLDATRRYSVNGLPGTGTTTNSWTQTDGVAGLGYHLSESNRWTWVSANTGTVTNYAVSLWLRNPVCTSNAVGGNLPASSIFVEPFLFELEGAGAAYPHWFLYWNGSAVALGLSTMILNTGGSNIHNFGQVPPATWADGGWHQLAFSQTESVNPGPSNSTLSVETFSFYVDGTPISTLPLTVVTNFTWQHFTKASSLWIGTNAIGVWAPGSTFHYDLDELKIESDFAAGQTAAGWIAGQYQNPQGTGQASFLNVDQTFTATNTFTGVVAANNPDSTFAGNFTGNGAGLTNLNLVNVNVNGAMAWTTNWGSFAYSAGPGVGASPTSVVATDVNGDGLTDLISANYADNTLAVLTNNGSGGFVLASTPNAGFEPIALVAADVNGDGHADLISVNYGSNTLSVLTNNGQGGFVLASSPDVGFQPVFVVAADVNQDGQMDLISANYGSNTLSVLTNNGQGGFVLTSSSDVGFQPVSLIAADMNGDGRVDLISANYGSNTLSVLTNNGKGGFVLAATPGVGFEPVSLAAADVNGDGLVDLISANYGSNTLSVLTNNGRSGFALSSTLGVGTAPMFVVAADVNGDGPVDLMSANSWDDTLTVLTNNGSGGMTLAATPGVGSQPIFLVATDVNRDGRPDLITANYGDNTLTVLTNAPAFISHFTGDGAGLVNVPASAITGGLTTNVAVLLPNGTHTFFFTNGLLMKIQ